MFPRVFAPGTRATLSISLNGDDTGRPSPVNNFSRRLLFDLMARSCGDAPLIPWVDDCRSPSGEGGCWVPGVPGCPCRCAVAGFS